jgi:hypothetical protein
LLFREKQPAVDGDLEYPSHPRHQFDFGAVKLNQPRPRTEGPRFIISRLAPLDSYLHRRLSQGLPAIPLTKLTRSRENCQSMPGYRRDPGPGIPRQRRYCRRPAHAASPSGPDPAAIGVAFGGGRREGLRQSREAGGTCGNWPRPKPIGRRITIAQRVHVRIAVASGVGSGVLPPASALLAYWMGGALLMAIKRYSEYRGIGDPARAALYRRSFARYTPRTRLHVLCGGDLPRCRPVVLCRPAVSARVDGAAFDPHRRGPAGSSMIARPA